jgi:uncharacterized protein involved in propanediol utilization
MTTQFQPLSVVTTYTYTAANGTSVTVQTIPIYAGRASGTAELNSICAWILATIAFLLRI